MALAIFAAILAANGAAPANAQGTTADLHGHVNNPLGQAVKTGVVKLTLDKNLPAKERTYKFTFPIDANGDYKGTGIVPGDYVAIVFDGDKSLDFQDITLRASDNKVLDFDMSRAEFLKGMSAEDKAALEEYKKKNAAVNADNAKIANINKVLLQAREDEHNGKADLAVTALKGLVELKPEEPVLWASLGEAQLALGDLGRKAAIAAKSPTNTPEVQQPFVDAATSYQKAIDLNAASKKPATPENLATFYLNLGQALSKAGKLDEAGAAYEMSAKTFPAKAGTAFFNESVVYYQASKLPEASAAADKAIAADPAKADAYYIKGQALIPGATVDKAGKIVAPPGCVEAYQQYLEIAPEGPHATEVKEILAGLGQPIKNSFKAGKKP